LNPVLISKEKYPLHKLLIYEIYLNYKVSEICSFWPRVELFEVPDLVTEKGKIVATNRVGLGDLVVARLDGAVP